MTLDTLALPPAAAPAFAVRRPALFSPAPIDPATALGRLFAAATPAGGRAPRRAADEDPAARALGPLAPALALLPERERERAAVLAAWTAALLATAGEADREEKRIERLHRSAFLVARALAGERVDSPFALRLARESARRLLPRHALDCLVAEARRAVREPLASTPAVWEARTRELAAALAEALLGASPSAAGVDAAAALLRLVRLAGVSAELARGDFHLPLDAPPTAGSTQRRETLVRAVADECEAIHPLLMRGARAVGEVPLTFRGALAGLIALGLRLLGRLEAHPESLLARAPRLGRLECAWALRGVRRELHG